MSEYLTWWMAGLGLGALAVTRWVSERRLLGVSSLVERVVRAPRAAPGCLPSSVGLRPALLFLGAIAVGAAIASAQRGVFDVRTSMGPTFTEQFGEGGGGIVALLVGGILVGLGTRMASGCTSGHGLSGCARLQPGSLVATATFMATAVAFTAVLGWVL